MSVAGEQKLNALTRYLEVENFDAVLIFTRTKNSSTEIAEKLEARGYAAAALNGDMSQSNREKVIARIKNKKIDIIVATDVAARGIDIDRISHVISYDIPYDTGSYVHRIGRTGRAGREGKALLLVTGREQRMLRDIERSINQSIDVMKPPSVSQIHEKRMTDLASKICSILAENDLTDYRELVKKIAHKNVCSEADIAAALICAMQKDNPVQEIKSEPEYRERSERRNDRSFAKPHGKNKKRRGDGGSEFRDRKDRKHRKSFKKFAGKKR
jgi:ATP-dependent RNA helicase DeaD